MIMRIVNITIFATLAILLSCCQNNKSEKYSDSEEVYDEAIKIHDEVMPLMGEVMELQKTLKIKKEDLSDNESIDRINISLQKLENAHNAMMVWMRNITPIPENISDSPENPSPEEMLKIQEKSLEDVKIVKEAILSSIDEANSLIAEL